MNKQTTTSTGKDYSLPNFWEIDLRISMVADRSDIPMNLSPIEVLLDALQAHQHKLYEELEWYRDKWSKDNRLSLAEVLEEFSSGDFLRKMEEIKATEAIINDIAISLAADLREIGNSIKVNRRR